MSVEYRHYIYTDSDTTIKVTDAKQLISKLQEKEVVSITDIAFVPSPIIPMGKDVQDSVDLLKQKYNFGIINAYGEQYIKRYNPLSSFLDDKSIDDIQEYVILFNIGNGVGQKSLLSLFESKDFPQSVSESGVNGDLAICSSRFNLIQPLGEMDHGIKNSQGVDIADNLESIIVEEESAGKKIYYFHEFSTIKDLEDGEYTLYGDNAMDSSEFSTLIHPTHFGITIELWGNTPEVNTLSTSNTFKDILKDTLNINQISEGRHWH
jgi:hypothetical protein